jgi:hypothetical protein
MSFNILLIIAATVVVFLILREVICWYFKINERVKLQAESNGLQTVIIHLLKEQGNSITTDVATEFSIDTDGVKRYK